MAEVAVVVARLGGRVALSALDLLLAAYVVDLALIPLTGGFDLWVLRIHEPAKPVFALLMLIPVRIAVGGRSWLVDAMGRTAMRTTEAVRTASARVPAAFTDTLFAIVTIRAATISAGFIANIVFDPAMPRGFTLPFSNEKFVEVFVAWDSGWYWDIATRGYYFRTDGARAASPSFRSTRC